MPSKESQEAKKAAFAEQTIIVDKDWRIERSDERNWTIWFRDEIRPRGYYGNVSAAIAALPDKMLNEQARESLASVARSMADIREALRKAITP